MVQGVPKVPGNTPQGDRKGWVTTWYTGTPTKKTNLQMREVIVVEQFCHAVSTKTQAWIRRHNPDILEEAVKLVEDFEDSLISQLTHFSS
ncbi:UNVERIFIED_CONTAM: hypothetical protein FKN15_012435 [Acipenser sinensis]